MQASADRRRCGWATRMLVLSTRCLPHRWCERCAFATISCLDRCLGTVTRIVGPFFVLLLLAIIAFNVYLYFTVMLPELFLLYTTDSSDNP